MSNYKNEILANNNDLQNILTKIDELPTPGIAINGLIEEYKVAAGENISAGDFVSWLQGNTVGEDNKILTSNVSGIKAVALGNTVFIAYGQNKDSYPTLYGIACEINGNTITIGSALKLGAYYTTSSIDAAAISDNKVFIAHSWNNTMNSLNGIVCIINGTTITAGTDTTISSAQNSGLNVSVIKLDEDKVFITHMGGAYWYLYGVVCTISGTTITAGADTQLTSTQKTVYGSSPVLLDANKIFISHAYDSNYLYGMVVTINGTTVTVASDKKLIKDTYAGLNTRTIKISDTTALIVYRRSTNIYGLICTINGSTVTVGTATLLLENVGVSYSGIGGDSNSPFSLINLEDNDVLINYSNKNQSDNLFGLIVNVNGTNITKISDINYYTDYSSVTYTGSCNSTIQIGNKIFVVHSYSNTSTLYLISLSVAEGIIPYDYETLFGIAKTGGSDGDTIDVYLLPTIE